MAILFRYYVRFPSCCRSQTARGVRFGTLARRVDHSAINHDSDTNRIAGLHLDYSVGIKATR